MTIMRHRGYEAFVDYDDDAALFHGEVVNMRDVITFQGRSVDELKQAFAESLDDYLDFCWTRGEEPEIPYSGDITVHVDPALHRAMMSAAKRSGVSLDDWLKRTFERATG